MIGRVLSFRRGRWIACAAAALAVLPACQPKAQRARPDAAMTEPSSPGARESGPGAATPVDGAPRERAAREPAPGLELWLWLVSDERKPIEIPAAPVANAPASGEAAPDQSAPSERAEGAAGEQSDGKGEGNADAKPARPKRRVTIDPPGTTFKPSSAREPAEGDAPPEALPPTISIQDDRVDLDVLLEPHAGRELPIAPEVAERWRRAGFRLIAVPVRDLAGIEFQARLTGVVQRQWLGVLPLWTDLARGARLDDARPIQTGAEAEVLPRGRPRLLARAWPVPIAEESGPGAALRVELVPQVLVQGSGRGERRAPSADAGRAPSIEDQGPILSQLLLSARLSGGTAIVIVPEEAAPAATESASSESGEPSFPPPRTLGQVLLIDPGDGERARVRQVLVLIPSVPSRVRLLP